MSKIAIMQPYFLPYIGYFQLINSVDEFVVYDNIEYTKKGWINRNRILVNGKDDFITLPLKKDSDYLHINKRFLAQSFEEEKKKLSRKINGAYRKAPFFNDAFPIIDNILNHGDNNLFNYILNSLQVLCSYLEIKTKISASSNIKIDHELRSEIKVIEICKGLNADTYINPIGGLELYSSQNFKQNNIELLFLKSNNIDYKQFNSDFVPWLSILDLLMFNSKENLKLMLLNFSVIK